MTDLRLDTVEGCIAELTSCNREVAEFADRWARDAGALKRLEKRWDRLWKTALRTTTGRNADERAATAFVAAEEGFRSVEGLDDDEPGISERIEDLVGSVTEHRTRFEAISRRSSNVQSIMKLRREEQALDRYTPREVGR